jgi:DNA-binding NtrC family response regulator
VGHVLIVDDEPDHRTTTKAILERDGLTVDCAADLTEALAALAAATYEVAIVDLRLPGGSGLAAMDAMRQVQANLQIVILTAYPSLNTCREALNRGAAAYVEKPFAPDALRALVAELRRPPAQS